MADFASLHTYYVVYSRSDVTCYCICTVCAAYHMRYIMSCMLYALHAAYHMRHIMSCMLYALYAAYHMRHVMSCMLYALHAAYHMRHIMACMLYALYCICSIPHETYSWHDMWHVTFGFSESIPHTLTKKMLRDIIVVVNYFTEEKLCFWNQHKMSECFILI